MGMPFFDNVNYSGKKPLDSRAGYDTVANMVAATKVYDGLMAYVTATKKYYTYDSTNEADPTLGKWREFEGGGSGGASALEDLSDVMLDDQTLAEGQHLEMGDSGRWVNAAPLLSKMDDVSISNPANKHVLAYNSTTQKWENKDTSSDKAIVNGYAYTPPLNSVEDFIREANASYGKTVTYNSGVFNNKSVKSIVLVYAPTKAYIIGSASAITFYPYNLKRSGSYYFESSRKATGGSNIDGYNITPIAYGTNITTVNSITIKGTSEVDVEYPAMPDNDRQGWIFYGGNATIDNSAYVSRTTKLEPTLRFYSDSAHTQEITPETGKFYIDTPTSDMYEWTGTAYQKVGGSSSGYDPSDAAFTDLADGDYVPMYDTSASATKKSLWSNIKSVLKTYFDTLYQGATDKMTSADMDDVVTPLPGTKASREIYSTTEQVIGKWIDGSDLYQTTITGNLPTTGNETYPNNSTSVDYDLGVSIGKLIKVFGTVKLTNNTSMMIPDAVTGNQWVIAWVRNSDHASKANKAGIAIGTNQALLGQPFSLTVQYTKPTT